MSYFTADNLETAHEVISRYPRKKSALIPLLHLAQEQEGWVTDDAMRQVALLTDTTPAEVKGTGSFYEMFKFHPVGTYMINVLRNLACQLLGGEELLAHAEEALEIKAGGTTADGMFRSKTSSASQRAPRPRACRSTIATSCGSPPTISIAHRRHPQRSGHRHPRARHARPGRQHIPAGAGAGIVAPEQATERPVWLARNDTADE